MVNKILQFTLENGLLEDGDRVLVALSGGADSVCLLHMMLSLKTHFAVEIGAVHVNHNLRGAEALRDAEFCKSLCAKLGITLHEKSVFVAEIAEEKKQSIETAAREVRYAAFDAIAQEYGYTKIAVAHNANDQAETVLMHLLRGSGIEGLRGILPKRENIIRPLLEASRDEIEHYLSENAIAYVTDSTNEKDAYLRNRIRLDLLPKLIEEYNPNLVKTLSHTAMLLQNDSAYMAQTTQQFEEMLLFQEDDFLIIETELYPESRAVSLRVIKKAIALCIGKTQDIPYDTVLRCDDLCRSKIAGKCVDLPLGYVARAEQDCVVIGKKDVTAPYRHFINGSFPGEIALKQGTLRFELTDCAVRDTKSSVCFDYDKLIAPLWIRNRRQGDFLHLKGMDGTKKLKEFFIDEKIPKHLRDTLPLLCCGDDILWVCGVRKCTGYDVDENTQKVLKCTYRGN